ncbi:MAG: hypothetical protein GY708_25220 [Actinomycetia bacterium]|nr:hypothetical protein [Actinomycetes bacterium]MCP4961820.1 hypothetical protein [Actinomycetes bacterium]
MPRVRGGSGETTSSTTTVPSVISGSTRLDGVVPIVATTSVVEAATVIGGTVVDATLVVTVVDAVASPVDGVGTEVTNAGGCVAVVATVVDDSTG